MALDFSGFFENFQRGLALGNQIKAQRQAQQQQQIENEMRQRMFQRDEDRFALGQEQAQQSRALQLLGIAGQNPALIGALESDAGAAPPMVPPQAPGQMAAAPEMGGGGGGEPAPAAQYFDLPGGQRLNLTQLMAQNRLQREAEEAAKIRFAEAQRRPSSFQHVETAEGIRAFNPETGTLGDVIGRGRPAAVDSPKPEGMTPAQQFNAVSTLSNQYSRNTGAAQDIKRSAGIMSDTWKRFESGKAKDLNATTQTIISAFNRMNDPGSTVRESEYARTPEGQSFLQRLEGKAQSIREGGPGVTPASLKEFVDLAQVFDQRATSSISKERARIERVAKASGVDPTLIFGEEEQAAAPDGGGGGDPLGILK